MSVSFGSNFETGLSRSSVSVESMLGLPYHVPEPRTIDQVFKKRARPEGPAMALLK